MNYLMFHKKILPFHVFSINDIDMVIPGFLRLNLNKWAKKGHIKKIRNGWYYFTESIETENIAWLSANLIYAPSYISLHSALSYYNLIPEGIYTTTSVTTNKTKVFKTDFGAFFYRNVKESLFGFGHKLIASNPKEPEKSRQIIIAEPEKAILDLLYLNPQYNDEKEIEGLRFDEYIMQTDVSKVKLYNYLEHYQNIQLEKRIKIVSQLYLT